jgi:S-adenosylmethionine/arginine decarboxylase-like enzyme
MKQRWRKYLGQVLEHKFIVIRAFVKKPPLKGDEGKLTTWLEDLIGRMKMKILAGPFVRHVDVEGNRGLTGCTLIETSHVALHVWDEPDPALMMLHIYTCGAIDPAWVLPALDQFEPVTVEWKLEDHEHGFQLLKYDLVDY